MSLTTTKEDGSEITPEWMNAVQNALGYISGVGARPTKPYTYDVLLESSTYYLIDGTDGTEVDNNSAFHTLINNNLADGDTYGLRPATDYMLAGKLSLKDYEGVDFVAQGSPSSSTTTTRIKWQSDTGEIEFGSSSGNVSDFGFWGIHFDGDDKVTDQGFSSDVVAGSYAKHIKFIDCRWDNFASAGHPDYYALDATALDYVWLVRNQISHAPFRFVSNDKGCGQFFFLNNVCTDNSVDNFYFFEFETGTTNCTINGGGSFGNQFFGDTSNAYTRCAYLLHANGEDINGFRSFGDRTEGVSLLETSTAAGKYIDHIFIINPMCTRHPKAGDAYIHFESRTRGSLVAFGELAGLAAVANVGIDDDNTNMNTHYRNRILHNTFTTNWSASTMASYTAATTVKGNIQLNPIDVVATPFDNANYHIEVNGSSAVPDDTGSDYTVCNSDIMISSTDSGGADCAIDIQDSQGNTLLQATLSTITLQKVPMDYVINWGAYSGADPTVIVGFI